MKNQLIIMALIMLSMITYGQCFKTDFKPNPNTGLIKITEKILVPGKSQSEIFDMANIWGLTNITDQYHKSQEILNKLYDDKRTTISNKELGLFKGTMQLSYKYRDALRYILCDITIKAGEGEYIYTINGLNMNRKPIEEYLKGKSGDPIYDLAFEDICGKLKATIDDIKESIK